MHQVTEIKHKYIEARVPEGKNVQIRLHEDVKVAVYL